MPRRHEPRPSRKLIPYNTRASPQGPESLFSAPLPWLPSSPPPSSTSSSSSGYHKARMHGSMRSRASDASSRSRSSHDRDDGYESRNESDTESFYTSISQVSACTFGDRDHPAYAPGQAPRGFHYSSDLRREWRIAGRGPDGRKVRFPVMSGSRERGFDSSQWGSEWGGSSVDGRSQGSGSRDDRCQGYYENRSRGSREQHWDGAMLSPPDSDYSDGEVASMRSRATSQRSRPSRRRERYYSPPSSEASWGPEERFGGERELSIANGRLVREEKPRWAR